MRTRWMVVLTALLMTAFGPVGAASADDTRREAAPPKQQTVRERIEQQLAKPVTLEFPGTVFGNVVDFLQDLTGVNIVVEWRELRAEGIGPQTTIALRLTEVPLQDALRMILDQVDIEYVVTDAAVLMTSREKARGMRLEAALSEPVSLEVQNKWFAEVILDLHKQTGLMVMVAPEAVRLLPKGSHSPVTMNVKNVRARVAYEHLANLVGLVFVTRDGKAFYEATGLARRSAGPPAAKVEDPIVGRIVTKEDAGSVTELYIRASDLPRRLRLLKKAKIMALIERLEQEVRVED